MPVTGKALTIARLGLADRDAWATMRLALWPDQPLQELTDEIAPMVATRDFAAFGARAPDGRWLGMVEIGARSVAEGCLTTPVGYIEALWVDASVRRQGVARRLVEAATAWSREQGYCELASDTNLDNGLSQEVHRKLGFTETERLVTFRKDLRRP